jgi:hypothetical protein
MTPWHLSKPIQLEMPGPGIPQVAVRPLAAIMGPRGLTTGIAPHRQTM